VFSLYCHYCGCHVASFGEMDRHAAATLHLSFDCPGLPGYPEEGDGDQPRTADPAPD
jgi:hypothetical protein